MVLTDNIKQILYTCSFLLKAILFFFFLLLSIGISAQQPVDSTGKKIEGAIKKDSVYTVKGCVVGRALEETLPGAHIYVGVNKRLTAITDISGKFVLGDIPQGELVITVSFVGYKFATHRFLVKADTSIGYIMLQPEILEEVTITATPPLVIQNGDTTQFNAAAVKLPEDAYLEDLLKKLPGFQLIDGKLVVNGKEVEKLYIDGAEYFINDPMTALTVLPANIISKIKLYDDKNEKSKFSGFDDGNRLRSLNIETKNPDQMKVFGNASLGHNISENVCTTFKDNNYSISGNANMFNKKQKLSFNISSNRTSQGEELPNPLYKGEGGDNSVNSVMVDFSNTFSKDLLLGGSYRFGTNERYSASFHKQDYFPTDYFDNRILSNETHSWTDGDSHGIRIQFKNQNYAAKNQISFNPSFTRSTTNSRSLNLGNSVENSDTVNVTNSRNITHTVSTNVGGTLNWAYRLTIGNTLNCSFNGNVSRTETNGTQQDSSMINKESILRNLVNSSENVNSTFSVSSTYTKAITKKINFSLDYTFNYNKSQVKRESMSYEDPGFTELIGIDSALTHQTIQTRFNNTIGAGLNYRRDKDFYLSANINIQLADEKVDYRYLNTGDSIVRSKYCDLSPKINWKYIIDSIRRIEFSYSGNTTSPKAEQLQDVLDVTDQLNVSKGNPYLKKTFSQNISFQYNDTRYSRDSYSYFNASLSFNNSFNQSITMSQFIEKDTVIDGYTILKGARLTMPVNLNGRWSISVATSYSFKLKPLKLDVTTSLNYNYSRTPSINDNVKNFSNEHRGGFDLKISSNISEKIDFNVNSSTGYTRTTNTAMDGSSMIFENVNANFNWTAWKDFVLAGDYSFNYTLNMQQRDITTTNSTLNLTFGKKFLKNKQLYLRFQAQDILRQKNIENYHLRDTYAQTSYDTSPRNYYLITLTYRFNSMNRTSGKK